MFSVMEMAFWLSSAKGSSGLDAMSSLLHIFYIYHRDNQKLVINRGQKSSNCTLNIIFCQKKGPSPRKGIQKRLGNSMSSSQPRMPTSDLPVVPSRYEKGNKKSF